MEEWIDTQIDRQIYRKMLFANKDQSLRIFLFPIFVRNMCKSCAEFRASVALAPR